MLRSRWSELDAFVKVAVILGLFGGSALLFFVSPFLVLWVGILTPFEILDILSGPFPFVAFAIVTLTPFFLYATSIVLIFVHLSQETRGILGFLLFIGGAVTTFSLLPFLIASARVN